MATVHDVAAYILAKHGEMSAMKLQKLVYYSQAWHATWEGRPLFGSRIEAWANGPVVPELYREHRGKFIVTPGSIGGDPDALDPLERENVDIVVDSYGEKTPQWLSDLTHNEDPWMKARDGLRPSERSSREISLASIAEYYSSL